VQVCEKYQLIETIWQERTVHCVCVSVRARARVCVCVKGKEEEMGREKDEKHERTQENT
jgi:hypothetical protein